jgi:hypothetical protein
MGDSVAFPQGFLPCVKCCFSYFSWLLVMTAGPLVKVTCASVVGWALEGSEAIRIGGCHVGVA